jgi:hypothetical protein
MGHDSPPTGPRQHAPDPGAQSAIRQSAAFLARDQAAFTRQLHADVTSLIPDSALPQAFDMWGFCDRMAQALLWVALTDQPPAVVIDALRQLGARNWSEGFPESQYASVAHALIQTLHYLNENIWSTATGSTWISICWPAPATRPPARPPPGKRPPARPPRSAPPPSRRPPASRPWPATGTAAIARWSATSTSSGWQACWMTRTTMTSASARSCWA